MNWRYLGFAPAAFAVASHVIEPLLRHEVIYAISPHGVEPFPMYLGAPSLSEVMITPTMATGPVTATFG